MSTAVPQRVEPAPARMAGAVGESGENRLMITKIVCENFKSYAGKKEVGPFHKCFSAVVGPNGSGKSNVIDSLMFVFAKGAKQMRHKKAADLIHKSAEHPDCKFCLVEVHFQNIVDTGDGDEDYEVVSGSRFAISRRVVKGGTSTYRIAQGGGGKAEAATMQDVTKYLLSRGIDLDNNRFLILQGEVESIATMEPKVNPTTEKPGMLEFLEELIGSNKHVGPIAKAEESYEKATDARKQVLEQTKQYERKKDELEGSKNQAIEFYDKCTSLLQEQGKRDQCHAALWKKEAEKQNEGEEAAVAELTLAVQHKQEFDEEAQEKKDQIAAQNADFDVQKAEVAKHKKSWDAFERKDVKQREELKHMKNQIKKHEKLADKERKKAAASLKAAEQCDLAGPRLESEVSRAETDIAEESKKLEEMEKETRGQTDALRGELTQKQEQLLPHSEAMDESKAKADTAKAEAALVTEQTERAAAQVEQIENTLREDAEQRPAQHKKLEEMKAEHAAGVARLPVAEKELAQAMAAEPKAKAATHDATKKLEAARTRGAAARTSSRTVAALAKASAPGGPLHGIGYLGRLGDLGAIDEKYDVAITTAAGGALNQLVCENAAGAKKCVQWLKDTGVGTATFVMLDKLGYLQKRMDAPVNPKPAAGVPRLFDLITPREERLRPAFYKAVRNTLVAKNLDDAAKIAYAGDKCVHQVVTLEGQIISQSGTMSGGGTKIRKGGMKAEIAADPVDKKELAKLEHTAATATKELEAVRTTISSLKKEVAQLKRNLPKLEAAFEGLEMELAGADERMEQLKAQLDPLREAAVLSDADGKRVNELQAEEQKHLKAYAKAEKQAAGLRAEVDELQKQIKDVGGPRLRRQLKKVENLTESLDTTRSELAKNAVDAKNERKNAVKSEAAAKEAQAEAERLAAQRKEVKESFKTVEDEAAACFASKEAAEKKLEEMKRNKSEDEKWLSKMAKRENKLMDAIEDAKEKVDKIKENVRNAQSHVEHWEAEFETHNEQYQQERSQLASLTSTEQDGEEQASDRTDFVARFPVELSTLEEAELAQLTTDKGKKDIEHKISLLTQEKENLERHVDHTAIKSFRKAETEYLARVKDLCTATDATKEAREELEGLKKKRLEEFHAGFSLISNKLKEMYQMITLGGDAELELVDSLDPFAGIIFSVRPNRKSWKPISMLSGGEKTLASLALVFALHHCYPTPLYVMDEIDAALDYRNVSIVANYIKERTRNAQFIIISLRNNMFELADRLVGIYKTHNSTKSVTINPKKFATAIGAAAAPPAPPALGDATNVGEQSEPADAAAAGQAVEAS